MSVNSDFFVSIYYLVVYLNLNKLVIDLGLIFYHQLFSFQGSILFLLTVSPDSLFIIHYFVSFVNTFFRLFLKSFVISNSFKSVFIGWLRRSQQQRLFIILVLFDLSTPFFDFLNFFFEITLSKHLMWQSSYQLTCMADTFIYYTLFFHFVNNILTIFSQLFKINFKQRFNRHTTTKTYPIF